MKHLHASYIDWSVLLWSGHWSVLVLKQQSYVDTVSIVTVYYQLSEVVRIIDANSLICDFFFKFRMAEKKFRLIFGLAELSR